MNELQETVGSLGLQETVGSQGLQESVGSQGLQGSQGSQESVGSQRSQESAESNESHETYCYICYEEYSRDNYILKDSCLNHDIISDCKHWFCIHCLSQMYQYNINNCPLCRVDISELIDSYSRSDSVYDCNCDSESDYDSDYDSESDS